MKRNKLPIILQNSLTGIIASLISICSTYSIRIVISHVLGKEIYGVNSIFISIVSALLIFELGMSTAMIIILYQPVANNEHEKIKSILGFYKKFYRIFCLILFILGILTAIFLLKGFVKTDIALTHIQVYFIIYLLSIVLKYLWSYKSCLLYANRENSVVSIITIIITLLFAVFEVLSLLLFKEYWLYLIIFLFQNISLNALCNLYVNKNYKYITEKNVIPLEAADKKKLLTIIRPMFVQRMANQIQDASSVLILGAVGTNAIIAGYFSNYIFVVHACQTLFNQISASFTTSFGNYSASNDNREAKFRYYEESRFCMSWVAVVFSSLYLCLIQSFITLFFDSDYCMSETIALLLTCYVFTILNSSINLATQNALGAHYVDTKEMIIQAIIGITLSTLLGMCWGALGIVVGMLVSAFIFSAVIKGAKIFMQIFQKKWYVHITMLCKELLCFIVASGFSYLICRLVIRTSGIISIIASVVVVFIITNVILIILNLHSKNLIVMKNVLSNILQKSQ